MSNAIARDAQGRFKNGNAGGPGRPRHEIEKEYLDALYEVIPLERFKRMVDKVASHVETTGSIKGFEAIADRMFGKPVAMEPSAGQSDDKLFAVLAEIAERRKAAQQERQVKVIDVAPEATQ